jgi:methylase of polypeptide subunit release factors
MPFGYIPIETPISVYEAQVHDPGYRAIGKFFTEARSYLKPGGRLLIGFSSDIGNVDEITRLATANRFSFTLLESTKGMEHEPVSMEIWESRPEEI